MKKSDNFFLKFIFMAFCFYSAQALAFVDPPTFAPIAPNSAQSIVASVRSGICHGLGFEIPGGRPLRIEYSDAAIDIFSPGLVNPSGFCNLPIATNQFNITPRPAGNYQVRIWILNDLAGTTFPNTVLGSQAVLTVSQGTPSLLASVPSIGIGSAVLLIALIFAIACFGAKRFTLFSIAIVSSTGFAQSNEKTLLVLLSSAPGAPAPIALVEPINFSGGYLGVLSAGFVAENPTRAFYLLPRRATGDFNSWIQNNPNEARAKLERQVIIVYPPTANLQNALMALRNDPNVVYATQMPLVDFATPAQNQFSRQPGLISSAFSGTPNQTWITDLGFDRAWIHAGGWGLVATIDNGLNTTHPDFLAFNAAGSYTGGNFLSTYAADAGQSTSLEPPGLIIGSNADERRPVSTTFPICDPDGDGFMVPSFAGHGSHTAGLISANHANFDGIQGACKNCGIAPWRIGDDVCNTGTGTVGTGVSTFGVIASLTYTTDIGVQVTNQSFGFLPEGMLNRCAAIPNDAWCLQMTYAQQRGVLLVAASGNARTSINFPAQDPRVVAVGGLEPDLSFWNERLDLPPNLRTGECPNSVPPGQECGSNFTATSPGERRQEITMPARDVYSTAYPGATWNQFLECGDATDGNPSDGRGLCTGTSMSAPLYSGLAGLLRSINPLLLAGNPENAADAIGIRDVVVSAATVPGGAPWSPQFGYGIPDAEIAAKIMLGTVAGNTVKNRLTPLFSLYSVGATDWAYVTVPQAAVALINYTAASYAPRGTLTFGYNGFPESATAVPAIAIPLASTFVLTTEFKANVSHPNTVPLYWLDRSRSFPVGCTTGSGCNLRNRDFLLVTSVAELEIAKADGYDFRGLQGYVYDRCAPAPACVPRGAEKLYRQCKVTEDDCAIFLESERSVRESEGYVSAYPVGSNMHIGYAYPNIDSDADNLIDGLEYIIGTNPTRADSDGDGLSDAAEFPLAGVSVSDPCVGPNIQCGIDELFANGFE